jgi:hypothetical protein
MIDKATHPPILDDLPADQDALVSWPNNMSERRTVLQSD